MEVILLKSPTGALVPADPEQAQALSRFKAGDLVRGEFKLMQNGQFHRKMMALLNLCYEHFRDRVGAGVMHRGHLVKPCFDTWRKNFTIMAGHFEVVFNARGMPVPKAKSLSFAKMPPDEREQVYSDFIDAALKHVYDSNMTEAQLRNTIDQIMSYT